MELAAIEPQYLKPWIVFDRDMGDVLPPPTLISATADTRLEAGAYWELPSNDRILTNLSPGAPRFLLWLTLTGARLRS